MTVKVQSCLNFWLHSLCSSNTKIQCPNMKENKENIGGEERNMNKIDTKQTNKESKTEAEFRQKQKKRGITKSDSLNESGNQNRQQGGITRIKNCECKLSLSLSLSLSLYFSLSKLLHFCPSLVEFARKTNFKPNREENVAFLKIANSIKALCNTL